MAQQKKSFVLYCDLIHTVRQMPKEKAADLFLHILSYVNDENPITDDLIVNLTFEPIKQQLKRDLKDWEKEKELRSIAGRLGNLKRWNLQLWQNVTENKISLDDAENIAYNRKTSHCDDSDSKPSQTIANVAVNVNGTVTDTVTVIKENIKSRKQKFSQLLEPFLEQYGREMLNEFFLYWTEHGENDRKMKFEKQKSFGISLRLNTWFKNQEKFKEKSSAKKESNEPKVGRMTLSDAQKSIMNAASARIPGT